MNKVSLVGRTTKDIEVRYTEQTQTAVCRFTLAVNRRKKDDGADFISCQAWGKTAELMGKYVSKGDRIGVNGRIQTGSYKKDDRTIYTTDVVVEELEFLESKGNSAEQKESTEPKTDENGFMQLPENFEEELPF